MKKLAWIVLCGVISVARGQAVVEAWNDVGAWRFVPVVSSGDTSVMAFFGFLQAGATAGNIQAVVVTKGSGGWKIKGWTESWSAGPLQWARDTYPTIDDYAGDVLPQPSGAPASDDPELMVSGFFSSDPLSGVGGQLSDSDFAALAAAGFAVAPMISPLMVKPVEDIGWSSDATPEPLSCDSLPSGIEMTMHVAIRRMAVSTSAFLSGKFDEPMEDVLPCEAGLCLGCTNGYTPWSCALLSSTPIAGGVRCSYGPATRTAVATGYEFFGCGRCTPPGGPAARGPLTRNFVGTTVCPPCP